MDIARNLSLAKNRIQLDGLMGLFNRLLNRSERKIVQSAVFISNSEFSDLIVTYHDLIETSRPDSFWWLKDGVKNLSNDFVWETQPFKNKSHLKAKANEFPMEFKDPFVTSVTNVSIVGPDAVPLTKDNKLLTEAIHWQSNGFDSLPFQELSAAITDQPLSVGRAVFGNGTPPGDRWDEPVAVLQSQWTSYYHWTLEHLLKIRGVRYYEEQTGDSVTLIIPSDPPSYIRESLSLMGYDSDEYFEWDGRPIRADTLVLPSYPELTPGGLAWIKEQMTAAVQTATGNDWLYISRQNAGKRRIDNFEEIQPVLKRYGVDICHLESLSLAEQIQRLSEASVVIAPHGAGLSNMVWANDLHIVEIFNDVIQPPFYILSQILEHEYDALSGTPTGVANERYQHDIVLNPGKLEACLEQLPDQR